MSKCKVCKDVVGKTSRFWGSVGGPLCKVCFDRLERESLSSFSGEKRETWAKWLERVIRG